MGSSRSSFVFRIDWSYSRESTIFSAAQNAASQISFFTFCFRLASAGGLSPSKKRPFISAASKACLRSSSRNVSSCSDFFLISSSTRSRSACTEEATVSPSLIAFFRSARASVCGSSLKPFAFLTASSSFLIFSLLCSVLARLANLRVFTARTRTSKSFLNVSITFCRSGVRSSANFARAFI